MSTPSDEQGLDREGSGKRRNGAANALEFTAPEASGKGAAPAAPAAETSASKRPRRRNGAAPPESVSAAERDMVPDAVMGKFIKVGRQFYFPDGAEAFQDQGKKLTTRSENAVVIQSMVSIAQSRGAIEVQVSGSEFFRREAWFAARVAGLEVKGYKPTELEQERVVRAIGRRESAARGEAPQANAVESAPVARTERGPARESAGEGLIVGRLVDHGPAPFQHRPDRAMSYYVRLETDRGEVEHWGLDLERALRQSLSRPGIGDEVGLRKLGSEPVTVRATRRDEAGREIGQETVSARRNQWSLERREFLEERAQMAALMRDPAVSANDATRRFPELDGSYVQLQVAQSMVEQRFKGKLHREQFMEHLRSYLAREIEQGQPLEPVPSPSRAQKGTVEPRVHDRDYQPVR
jgi:conjugative element/phage-associated large polyvalent protein